MASGQSYSDRAQHVTVFPTIRLSDRDRRYDTSLSRVLPARVGAKTLLKRNHGPLRNMVGLIVRQFQSRSLVCDLISSGLDDADGRFAMTGIDVDKL